MSGMKRSYVVYRGVIPGFICDAVKDLRAASDSHQARMSRLNPYVDENVRKGEVCFLPKSNWMEFILRGYCSQANKEQGWSLDVNDNHRVQVATYRKGDFFSEHSDSSLTESMPTVRKVTAVALLTDPSEFTGGEFTLEGRGDIFHSKGDVLVFPSLLRHEVRPVEAGERISATLWATGPAFK